MFAPAQSLPAVYQSDSDDGDWESETESDLDKDDDYFEAWESQPTPRTFKERDQRNAEKRKIAAEKHRIAEMRSAEHREGGVMDNQQGV
jgi:hypothetical protein